MSNLPGGRDSERFEEPSQDQTAGTMTVVLPPTAYQRHMAAQGIPIHEAPGFHDVRELELADWNRLGCRGAFLVPDGTLDLLGMHVLEIGPGQTVNPQRHLYEEKYFVLEGEGLTELWQHDGSPRQRFEWHAGSLFAIPINTTFQLTNAGSGRVVLIVGNTAPLLFNIFDNEAFVLDNDYLFTERYDAELDAFDPKLELLKTPELRRAMWKTNVVPDIVDCELPLDNQRSPGYRRIEPFMAGGNFTCFIGEHTPGRYSKAHAHQSLAVLIAIKGKGYTYNWPMETGVRPWENGHAERVERVDYVAGGLVAAAPGGGDWFHQHFPTGKDGLRLLVFIGGPPNLQYQQYGGRTGRKTWLNADIEQGGSTISYRAEDPRIREDFAAALAAEGIELQMPAELYT